MTQDPIMTEPGKTRPVEYLMTPPLTGGTMSDDSRALDILQAQVESLKEQLKDLGPALFQAKHS